MQAYKFLARGGVGPFSGLAWPDTWIEVVGPLASCVRGIHVCRPDDLAHWLHDELWEVEADGDQTSGLDCLVVRRARLVRRIDAWSDGGARQFAEASIAHAAEVSGAQQRELLDDATAAVTHGYVAVAAYAAALAVSRTGADPNDAYAQERTWQSRWIASHVI